AGRKGRVVQLKLKLADFTLLTRQLTLPQPSDDGQEIYRAAMALLGKLTLDRKVRLTGISVQGMESESNQLKLFAEPGRSDKLNQALDRTAEKLGSSAVVPADVFTEGGSEDDLRRAPGASRLDLPAARRSRKDRA